MVNPFEQQPVSGQLKEQAILKDENPENLPEIHNRDVEADLHPMTCRALAAELGVDDSTLRKIANKYRDSNPEYFENKKHETVGRILEYYMPELVSLLRGEVSKFEKAPEGWKTNKHISTKLGVSQKTAKKIGNEYRQSNPEFFKEYKDAVGKTTEHYAPELVEIIIKRLSEYEVAPEGWETNHQVAKGLKTAFTVVEKIADNYHQSKPEYFKQYKTERGLVCDYYSPELVQIIRSEFLKFEKAPEGWKTRGALANELGMGNASVKKIADPFRQSNPEYFKELRDTSSGIVAEYYDPALVDFIKNEATKFTTPLEGWHSAIELSRELKAVYAYVQKIAEKYRETNTDYFKYFKTKRGTGGGKIVEYYSPELSQIIQSEISKFETAPEGWKTNSALTKELRMAKKSVQKIAEKYRQSNPEYFKFYKDKVGKATEHYSPELIEIIFKDISRVGVTPDGWKTNNTLAKETYVSSKLVSKIADNYRKSNPDYFQNFKFGDTGSIYEHYSPVLVDIIKAELQKDEDAPEGWKTSTALAKELMVSRDSVTHIAGNYSDSHPEYFKNYKDMGQRLYLHYSPELVKIITQAIEQRNGNKKYIEQEENSKQSLENFVQEISDPKTKDERARKIREIMELLPENACDILLKYHPEYSGLKNEYVKSVIADYLGDFLLVRKTWQPKDIEMTKELFSEERFAEALFIKFKEASFAYYQKEKKDNPEEKDYNLAIKYFEQQEFAEAAIRIPEVQKTIERLREYYEDIFKWANKKPDTVVESLKEGRVFPDINQIVNIKEIADNGKMLIADEMGLGKSASVILAKEYLGLRCAVIVMPSNVEDTWKNYLSDKIDDKGKQKGYFKKDAVPRVLTIEDKDNLERLKTEAFDYILISQEKMSKEHYLEALEKVDFDMLIIDEVHKLKNIEDGIRSENAIRLADKIQGQDKYLAMLSGTPMPNKVKDLAIILKLLYPEKYKDTDDKALIERIIYGDMADLRQELFSRMQMKEVAISIELPPLIEEPDVEVELAEEEKEVYQILLEEDELTASEKIIIFRQFLLNPQLLGMEPGFEGSKVKKLKETLAEDLKSKNRIIVWANSYIDGVIRPETDADGKVITEDIISRLDLPKDIMVRTIHGEDKSRKKYRAEVQKLFNNGGYEKMVLFVSGSAADVGVDFSGADGMIHYNEPWSKYDKRQQEGRAHREGQKGPQTVKTLITKGTIEEGIRRYTNAKEKAIEKLLRGLDRTEAENEMLKNDALSKKRDVEADKNLSRDYTSDWEKLMLHFGQGWQAGETWFKNMPEEERESYARLYWETKKLSYQGNNARISATLLEKMITDQKKDGKQLRILDIASGPEMLKRCVRENLRNQIYSMDINGKHFEKAVDEKRTFERSYLDLPVRSDSVDYYNIGFAFHQTKPIKFYKKNYERLQVLAEMNRVLKIGGRAVISEIHNAEFENHEKLEEILKELGMRIVKRYSGKTDGGVNYQAHYLTLEKVRAIDSYGGDVFRLNEEGKRQKIRELGDKLGRELLAGLEIKKLPKGASRLEDQRRMIDSFKLGGQEYGIRFTDEDKQLFLEEKNSIRDGEALKQKYGGRVDDIPLSEVHRIGFKRKLRNPNLMYKIIENGGVIVVRGDKQKK